MENEKRQVRCDACGCAFVPELLSQREGEIEYTFFRCDYCGKAFMASVTDEALRRDIKRFARIAAIGRKRRLSEKERRKAEELLEENVKRSKELRGQYLREDGHDGE